MKEKCKFILKEGKNKGNRCGAFAMEGSEFCYFHNPAVSKEEKKEVRSKGAEGRQRTLKNTARKLKKIELKSPEQVSSMLEDLINLVRQNKILQPKAQLLQRLSEGLLKSLELGVLDKKLIALQKHLEDKDLIDYDDNS